MKCTRATYLQAEGGDDGDAYPSVGVLDVLIDDKDQSHCEAAQSRCPADAHADVVNVEPVGLPALEGVGCQDAKRSQDDEGGEHEPSMHLHIAMEHMFRA